MLRGTIFEHGMRRRTNSPSAFMPPSFTVHSSPPSLNSAPPFPVASLFSSSTAPLRCGVHSSVYRLTGTAFVARSLPPPLSLSCVFSLFSYLTLRGERAGGTLSTLATLRLPLTALDKVVPRHSAFFQWLTYERYGMFFPGVWHSG